ncbi:MAG: MFS transporter [Actinomycetota bacterium]
MRFTLRGRPSEIWGQRQFRRFWMGETISVVGSSVTAFALPLVAVITLHATPGQMGVLRALGSAPGIFLGLLAGVWVDRVSRQRLLIATELIAAALIASVPVSYALGALSLGQLFAVAIGFGLLGPFWWPAWNAFLPSVAESRLLFDANSKMVLSFSASGVAGPGLGGVLVQTIGAPFALLFDAGSFVVSSLFLATVRPRVEERSTTDQTGTVLRRIVDGLRLTFLDPMQRAITIPRAILDFLDAYSLSVVVIYVIRVVGLSPGLMGLAFALSSVGFVVGSMVAPRVERRRGTGGAILLGLALVAVSPYTMVIANRGLPDAVNVLFFALPGLIGGFGGVVQHIGLQALRQSTTPERLLGRVYASASVLGHVMMVLGALAGGFIGEGVGLRPAVLVVAIGYSVPFCYALASPLRGAARAAGPRTEEPRGA